VRDLALNPFVTLLVVVDPRGLAPIFAAPTKGYSEKRKREAAIRGTVLGAAILLIFALEGDTLLRALRISIPAFRVAGAILLFLLALDMIFPSPRGSRSETVRQQEKESYQQDISVCPLATPARRARLDHDRPPLHRRAERHGAGGVRGRATRGSALTLFSFILAPLITHPFGETGSNALSRMLSVLLAALAVQFVPDGIGTSLG
jgi:multiple antibiotic resistance protein